MKGISIRDGKLSVVDFEDSYKFLREGVADGGDDTFTTAFRLPSLEKGRTIDAWVNDEGMLNGMKPSVAITFPYKYVYWGPMVITAGQGEHTVGLTDEELKLFALTEPCVFHFEKYLFIVPVIVLPRKYRAAAAKRYAADIYLF